MRRVLGLESDVLLRCHVLVSLQSGREQVFQRDHHRQLQLEYALVDVFVLQHVVQNIDGRVVGKSDVAEQVQNGAGDSECFQVRLQYLQASTAGHVRRRADLMRHEADELPLQAKERLVHLRKSNHYEIVEIA